jgi:hypothetical protein
MNDTGQDIGQTLASDIQGVPLQPVIVPQEY